MFLEITLVNFLLYVFATIGLTNILVYGKILDDARAWFKSHVPKKVAQVLDCYQCTGFWSGFVAGYILLTHDLFGVLMAGLAGSFLSEFAELIKEYIEANSMVSVEYPDEDSHSGEFE